MAGTVDEKRFAAAMLRELRAIEHGDQAITLLRDVMRLSPAQVAETQFRDRIRALLDAVDSTPLLIDALDQIVDPRALTVLETEPTGVTS